MKLKLKQSNSISKHLVLPNVKTLQQHRYTPRMKKNNRSLPKIPEPYFEQSNVVSQGRPKIKSYDKPPLKQKMKSLYQKPKSRPTPIPSQNQSFASGELEQINVISNFKKQIERNLVFIKKQKQNRKKIMHIERVRYNTPRHLTLEPEQVRYPKEKKSQKCVTQQGSVFSKLNEIIMKSQSRSRQSGHEPRVISYSSYIGKQKHNGNSEQLQEVSKIFMKNINAEVPRSRIQSEPTQKIAKGKQIKNAKNYHEWRKLSIDPDSEKKINYKLSSFDTETERLEMIRNQNEISIKKYIDGKSYLNKLTKYRDAALLMYPQK